MTADAPEPSSEQLERALHAAGLHCAVEARGRLAVLRGSAAPAAASAAACATPGVLAEPEVRARIVALARAHGFTHAALEL